MERKKEEIICNLKRLLELFEKEAKRIRSSQIREFMGEHFTSSRLDLQWMSEHFKVNSVYMSYIFKAEMGETFSSYL